MAKTIKAPIPAEYKTVHAVAILEAPREMILEISIEYLAVSKRRLVRERGLHRRLIPCGTNTTPEIARRLEQTSRATKFHDGPIDEAGTSRTSAE